MYCHSYKYGHFENIGFQLWLKKQMLLLAKVYKNKVTPWPLITPCYLTCARMYQESLAIVNG